MGFPLRENPVIVRPAAAKIKLLPFEPPPRDTAPMSL
eukprot:SAG25_NODE_3089_length_1223_cov_22.924357_1_plen_36_part_10